MPIRRIIRFYDKVNESAIGEIELVNIPLSFIQKIFHVEAENPMYDCYPVGSQELSEMKPYFLTDISIPESDLMLECEEVEDDAS